MKAILMLAATAAFCLAADPFVGTWKPVDFDQWKIAPGGSSEQSKRYLIKTELVGTKTYRNTFIPISSDAPPRPPSTHIEDGVERRDEARNVTTKYERIDDRHRRFTAKGSKGSVIEDFVVAPDGTTQTMTRKGIGVTTGREVDELLFFAKQDK